MANTKKDPGKPPDGFLHFLWLLRHGKTYWRELIGLALLLGLAWVGSATARYTIQTIVTRLSSVTMRVIHFDHATGQTVLEFDNKTPWPVPVEHVYLTVDPTNSAPVKPMPAEFQRLVSVFAKTAMLVPSGAGLEIGTLAKKGNPAGRFIRLATILVHEEPPLLLPCGITVTNVAPNGSAFADICGRFAPGAELEILIHTSLTDSRGRSRVSHVRIGNYVIGKNHTGLDRAPRAKNVDILRGGSVAGNASKRVVYSFSGRMSLPPLDEEVHSVLTENSSHHDVLVTIGKEIEGLVPVVLTKNSISYRCQFSVELHNGEQLPSDFSSWVLTRDGGKTVMNVPMAFSNNWSGIGLSPAAGRQYTIPLPSNEWQLLINGERWARVVNGAVQYTVVQKSWLKLTEADDVTSSFLSSNYNMIALQELGDDSSWVPVDTAPVVPTNSQPVLIVQNEVSPDLSILSTLQFPDTGSKSNSTQEKPREAEPEN